MPRWWLQVLAGRSGAAVIPAGREPVLTAVGPRRAVEVPGLGCRADCFGFVFR